MTSSSSSSGRRHGAARLAGAAVLLAAACAAASPPPRADRPALRVVLFPVENTTGASLSTGEFLPVIEEALAREGFEVVTGEAVRGFLARHRIRHTGVVEPAAAAAAREDLAADAVLVTTLTTWSADVPPRLGLTMRLVSTGEEPRILWIDGAASTGDEAPGLLGLGLVNRIEVLRERALVTLAASAARGAAGEGPRAPRCPDDSTFGPSVAFRGSRLSSERSPRVAVLPFTSSARATEAGERVALAFVRGLSSVDRFQVLEPGVVRDLLLRFRIILQGGVNLEQARSMLGALGVDLVVTGNVFTYEDGNSPASVRMEVVTTIIDGRTGHIVWQSTSYHRGDDGEWAFQLGAVRTADEVLCRTVAQVVEGMTAPVRPRPR